MEEESKSPQIGPMAKFLSYVGFGAGMVIMILFVPVSKSAMVNALIGGIVGFAGGGLGLWIGGLVDKSASGQDRCSSIQGPINHV